MNKWAEVRSDYYDEEEGKFYIDAWKTYDANEEGRVIAKVDYITEKVEYLDYDAVGDRRVHEIVKDIINEIRASKEPDKIYSSVCPWCGGSMSGSFCAEDNIISWYCDFCGFDVVQSRKEFEDFFKAKL